MMIDIDMNIDAPPASATRHPAYLYWKKGRGDIGGKRYCIVWCWWRVQPPVVPATHLTLLLLSTTRRQSVGFDCSDFLNWYCGNWMIHVHWILTWGHIHTPITAIRHTSSEWSHDASSSETTWRGGIWNTDDSNNSDTTIKCYTLGGKGDNIIHTSTKGRTGYYRRYYGMHEQVSQDEKE